jgi:ubiquinone biosynthesis protein COQ9
MKQNTDIKEKILAGALEIAGKTGWQETLLPAAAKAAGMNEPFGLIAFPDGVCALADYYTLHCNTKMTKQLEGKLEKRKIREKIEDSVMARLAIYAEHKPAVRALMAYYALPQHSLQAAKNLALTADAMWRLAGDTSTDFNYYTKRLLLSGVYSASLLYWLSDESADMAPTREFVQRRISNVMEIQKAKSALSGYAEKASGVVESILPKLRAGQ